MKPKSRSSLYAPRHPHGRAGSPWARSRRTPFARTWALALLWLAQCTPAMYSRGTGSVRGEIAPACSADFGATAVANELETFLDATAEFATAASDLEEDLVDACEDMAAELEIPPEALEGQPNQPWVQAACAPVAARIRAELSGLRVDANLGVRVAASPPRCEAEFSAYAACVGRCDAKVDPGALDVQCEGGELRGYCSARCTGSCAVDVDGACRAACEGACSGGCSGVCDGVCEGRCSVPRPDGSCAGRCEGVCRGTCSAGCSGDCDGQCVARGQAECDGECRGGCSVAYEEPYCTGTYRAPSASAECNAACEAQIDARVDCEPGRVDVAIDGSVSSNVPERVARLRAAIEGGMPAVLRAQAQLGRLAASGKLVVQSIGGLPQAVADLGLGAGACAAQAVALLPRATASVSVSLEVSATLSASAKVEG